MNEELTGKCLRPVVTFGLTRPVLEPMIYRIRGNHANHYATDAVPRGYNWNIVESGVKPIKQTNNQLQSLVVIIW